MKSTLPSTFILSSSEIKLHYKRILFEKMLHITCAEDAQEILKKCIDPNELDLRECFWVMLLSNANRVLAISEVATGTTKGVQTNGKYIFQLALLTNSSAIIVAHSHPSGVLTISANDLKETKKLSRLAKMMDVTLLDHIIITSESYTSFAEQGKL